jgi:tetratricopeptide (TPR) repeat protein
MTDRRRTRTGLLNWGTGLWLVPALAASGPLAAQVVRPGTAPGDDARAEIEFARRMGRAVNLVNVQHKIPEAIAEVEDALGLVRGRPGPREAQALDLLARLHAMKGDTRSRKRVLVELVAVRSKLLGPDHWSLKDIEFSVAECDRIAAMTAETRRLYVDAAQHVNRGNQLAAAGRFEDATVVLEQARAFYREFWDSHPDHAMCLHLLGVVHRERRQYARARELLEQALALRRKVNSDRHPRTVETLNALAWLHEAEGDLTRSRRVFERALALHQDVWKLEKGRLDQAERSSRAQLLERMARVLQAEGDLDGARDVLMQAVAARGEWVEMLAGAPAPRPSPRAGGPGPARPSGVQGPGPRGMLGESGQDTRARPSPFGLPGSGPRMGHPFGQPAPDALMDPEDEVAMMMEPVHPWSLRKRAWYAYRLAIEGARREDGLPNVLGGAPWIDRAITEGKVRGRPWIDYARSLGLLADVLQARGDWSASRPARLLSLAIGLEATDPSDTTAVDFARFLEDFDRVLINLGELTLARDVALMTVVSRRRSMGDRHPDYAAALETLAVVLWRAGDRIQATLLLEKALAVRRSAEGDRQPGLAADLDRLALLHAEQGDPDEARRYAAEALAVHEALIDRTLPSLPERVRLALLERSSRSLATFLDLTVSDPATADEAYRHLITWKGIATEAAVAQAAAARSPELRALTDDLNAARDALSRLYHAAVPPAGAGEHARRIAEQVKRRDDLEARLAEAMGWRPRAPRPAEVAAALPAGSALVDIARYVRRIPPTAEEVESRRRAAQDAHYRATAPAAADARYEPRYVAFVVRPGRESPIRVDLGPAGPIDQAIKDWLGRVERRDEVEEVGRRLRRALWEPLAPLLDGAPRVLLSPDGLLNFLPWGALPGQASGTYLLSERAFATIIAARQLVAGHRARGPLDGGLLTVGGVDYGAADDAREPPPATLLAARTRSAPIAAGPPDFKFLEKTLAETDSVADKYSKFAASIGAPDVINLKGAMATKRRILEAIRGRRFLHLATHGYFSPPAPPADPAPDAAADPTRGGADGSAEAPTLFPGLLSGLIFAGANRPGSDPLTGATDFGAGIMTAEEVAGLDLSSCELAVLSACETGRGRIARGEGVLGLQRSFHAAGARTVVASLWRVDDDTTRELMALYYDNLWRRRLGPLEALRQAQLDIQHGGAVAGKPRGIGETEPDPEPGAVSIARPHPKFWAAWILSGDPGEPPSGPDDETGPIADAPAPAEGGPAISGRLLALSVLLLASPVVIAWLRMRRARRRPA